MTKFKPIKLLTVVHPGLYLLLAGICCLVSLQALRANNVKMVELRAAVYQADKDNTDVRGALTALQRYVVSHMNTDLTPGQTPVYPPIQLKYTYERLQAANTTPTNDQVYTDAQAECERLNPTDFSGRNRVPCIQEYVSSHGATIPKAIPDSLYKYDFVSPTWSPDRAGWLSAATIGLVGLTVISFIARRVSSRRG